MNILIAFWTVFAAWRWADWKNWRTYYPTMLFIIVGESVYLFLFGKDRLWDLTNTILKDKQTELMYLFIILPGSTFIYLSNIPETIKRQIIHMLKWIVIFSGVEYIGFLLHKITYNHGWNWGWSVVFDCIMFSMLRLHHTKPALAFGVSFCISICLMFVFPPV